MSADQLLGLLDKVKRTGQGKYQACCPAHADKRPSLSIRELDDGRILVHCWAGCSVTDVLAAVGLGMESLFPERHLPHVAGRPERRPFHATDALRGIAFESLVVCAAAAALATGEPLSSVDRERLVMAGERIQSALSGAGL